MYKNKIIVFEGIDCAGKSTHITHVAKLLKFKKISFLKLREPGGSQNSEKIRRLLMNKKSNFNKKTDLLLYLASRSENFEKILNKKIQAKVILMDRFTDSTMAYQHYAMGLDKNIINILNNFVLKKNKPFYTFVSTVNKKNLIKRLKKRKKNNRYDLFNLNFYEKAQKGFIKIAKKSKKHLIIDSNQPLKNNIKSIEKKLIELKLI